MKRELARTNECGQPNGRSSVNSGKARQLAGYLPGCGLEKQTDEEAERLLEYLSNLAEAAYFDGWQGHQEYNDHMARLTSAPLSTGH